MANKEKIIEAVNYIRSNASQNYQSQVPQMASDDEINRIGFILDEQELTSEFTNGLVNRIIKTMVEKKSFKNPLKMFKKGSNPLGTDIQHMFTNPAASEKYELSEEAMAKLLSYKASDDKIVYYRRNRRDLYTVSVPETELRAAFVSWEALGELIDNKVMSLTNGNEIDEFAYTKGLLSKAVSNSTIRKIQIDKPTNNEKAKAFVKQIKKTFGKMKFPRSDLNSYGILFPNETPVVTQTNSERIALITDVDTMAEIDVELLADAFNLEKVDLKGHVVEVDEFSDQTLIAVLCDESFLQIYDNLLTFRNFYNGRALVYNYYVHAWSTFALSPFANAIAFVTDDEVVLPTGVQVQSTAITLNEGDSFGINAKVVPANASEKGITYTSSDTDVATVNAKGYITAQSAGTCTITVASNVESTVENPVTSATITVTVQ